MSTRRSPPAATPWRPSRLSFIDEVLTNGAGTLQELLGADWTIIDRATAPPTTRSAPTTADTYGLARGRMATAHRADRRGGRRPVGILNQGAFLSRFATATGSNPVQRGVAVMRRVACLDLADPVELDINVIPPVPDPSTPKTTRALYAAHAADPLCKTCHQRIDNFGFAFEQYDGIGAFRADRQEAVRQPRAP